MKKGSKHSKEHRKNISEATKKLWQNPKYRKKQIEARKGQVHWNKGKHIQTNTGRTHFKKGQVPWNKGKKGVMPVPWMKGKTHSKEARRQISEAHKGKMPWIAGKKHTPKSRLKMSRALKGLIPWNKGKTGVYSKETIRKISEATKKGMARPEVKKRLREGSKKAWARPELRKYARERRAKQKHPKKDSSIEVKVQNFLKELGIPFFTHKHIKEIENGYQCDIFIPSMNIIIECDGDYWHGNINNPKFKKLNKHQIKQKERDRLRTKELTEKGFKVVRLWGSDINKMNINEFKGHLEKPY